ncbi:hypothetical protein N0V88_005058 [Collariella sp. IMI 366227]|nr:hypothetical protein N0V88_005058 [Collariella sp. IMI 366227]
MALGSPQAIALGVSGGLIALIAVSLLYGFLMRKRATRLGSSYNAGNPTNRGRGFASHDDDAWDTRVAGMIHMKRRGS